MKPTYHQSEIADFLICAKRWYFRWVLQTPTLPSAALTLGSAVDETINLNFKQKIESKKDLSLEEMLDYFSSNFDRRVPNTDWRFDPAPQTKNVGTKLIRLHHEKVAPNIQPIAVQQKFHIELADREFNFGGTIDLIDSEGWVRDTKTSARSYPEDAVSRALQPAMYTLAYRALTGKPPTGFCYDVLVKTTIPKFQHVPGQVAPEDLAFLFEAAECLHDHITKGTKPAPTSEENQLCSTKYCPFWDRCKGKKHG